MTNIMLDLETLGTRPGSIILSICAVEFSSEGIKPDTCFYETIAVEDSNLQGFTRDSSTEIWWMNQSESARDEAFSGTKTVRQVLTEFVQWCVACEPDETQLFVWGDGADFDNVLLGEYFRRLAVVAAPWGFRNNRCYRTLKSLYPQISAGPFDGIRHNALADAIFQAKHAARIFKHKQNTEKGRKV